MNFLCPKHQRELAMKNTEEISALWSEWMTNATFYYDLHQWKDAAAFMGCAFELSMLALINNKGATYTTVKNMTLSAIGLSHCLLQMEEYSKNEQLMTLAQQQLLRQWPKDPQHTMFSLCLTVLKNESLHADFFYRYHPIPLLMSSPEQMKTARKADVEQPNKRAAEEKEIKADKRSQWKELVEKMKRLTPETSHADSWAIH